MDKLMPPVVTAPAYLISPNPWIAVRTKSRCHCNTCRRCPSSTQMRRIRVSMLMHSIANLCELVIPRKKHKLPPFSSFREDENAHARATEKMEPRPGKAAAPLQPAGPTSASRASARRDQKHFLPAVGLGLDPEHPTIIVDPYRCRLARV